MENNYKISHTAFPDGNVVSYADGMCKPHILSMDQVMRDSVFNAIVKKGKKRSAKIIQMDTTPAQAGPMYAMK